MRSLLIVGLACAWLFSPALGAAKQPSESGPAGPTPWLVTFGESADAVEGDHDFRQVIWMEVPAGTGMMTVRIFDPNVGGEYDEPYRGFNSRTRFTLYGEGSDAKLRRDQGGVIQEDVTGEPIASREYGFQPEIDGRWITAFRVDAAKGQRVGDRLRFLLLVEGVAGDDGNVFEVALARDPRAGEESGTVPGGEIRDSRLYSYLPTFQVPPDPADVIELRFAIPEGATNLGTENFDSASATLSYEGPFRSVSLLSSRKSEWGRASVQLSRGESGRMGSVTARSGEETPNDMTFHLEARAGIQRAIPVPIELPLRVFRPRPRPDISLEITPTGCRKLRFDAGRSSDPAGGDLAYEWYFAGESATGNASLFEREFDEEGLRFGRIEIRHDGEMVGNGAARNFAFLAKDPPFASFDAPAAVAEAENGTAIPLDASASHPSENPDGNRITRMEWNLGDGRGIIQEDGDPDFGVPVPVFREPGEHEVELTVFDDPNHPCNRHTASRSIRINAAPEPRVHAETDVVAGQPHVFEATRSGDPDGAIAEYRWDFGDGHFGVGPVIEHSYHGPGEYKVKLTVTDDDLAAPATRDTLVTVKAELPQNAEPHAEAGEDIETYVGVPVRFDARGSEDPDGNLAFYRWDFGDGGFADMPVVEHTFWKPGRYEVRLRVEDHIGDKDGLSEGVVAVDVAPAPNRPPHPELADRFEGLVFEALSFDASASSDPDGSIVSFDWDFGDGTGGSGPVIAHQYSAPGRYEATLALTDNGQPEPQVTTKSFTVEVQHAGNEPPVADAGPDATALTGEAVTFDASASRDPDGAILSHEWDFGDGHRSSGIATRHVYQFPGEYIAMLTVTDSHSRDRRKATDTRRVIVERPENIPPVAVAGPDIEAKTGEILEFDGSGSHDADGNILGYRWDFGDGGISQARAPLHTFHDPGTYVVRLRVTDDGVEPATADDELTVTVVDAEGGEASQ